MEPPVTPSDVATSTNACLGPPLILTAPACMPDLADAFAATVPTHVLQKRASTMKRGRSPQDGPPRKFAFAAHKPKDMQP